jgi:signal transduction histidine kinase
MADSADTDHTIAVVVVASVVVVVVAFVIVVAIAVVDHKRTRLQLRALIKEQWRAGAGVNTLNRK